MAQISTQSVTVRKIMWSADFCRGWMDGCCGAPWPKGLTESWDYERGRQFGILHPDLPPKIGKRVSSAAINAFYRAIQAKHII